MTFANHFGGRKIQRREQRRLAVSPVIVRATLGRTERHRQDRRRRSSTNCHLYEVIEHAVRHAVDIVVDQEEPRVGSGCDC
jgi:hypothetical protein